MHFQLVWKTIGLSMLGNSKAKVDVLLKKYENVFDGEKGTMKHFHAKLHVNINAMHTSLVCDIPTTSMTK